MEHVSWMSKFYICGSLTLFNRIDKKFYRPVEILRWVVVIYAHQGRFGDAIAQEMVSGLVNGCRKVGENQRSRFLNHR